MSLATAYLDLSIPSNDVRSVKQVTAIVANPNPNDPTDTGRVTIGYCVLDGDG